MMLLKVFAGSADELVGEFEFDQVPRVGEEIWTPLLCDDGTYRVFTVEEVMHLSAGIEDHPWGGGPRTVLRCFEIE